jgi:hypothetical protein
MNNHSYIPANNNLFIARFLQTGHTSLKQNFDWLLGNWQRTTDASGRTIYENWYKMNSVYNGLGYTMVENDTVFKEILLLHKVQSTWTLDSIWSEEPTYFDSETSKEF